MKFLTKVILVLFVFFQFSTSIVYLIDADKKTKIAMVFDEEENSKENSKEESKEVKEFKTEFISEKILITLFNFEESATADNHGYVLKDYSSNSNLFLPPPEQV